MKISSFLEHWKAKRRQFLYDRYRIMVSLRARRYNWVHHYPFDLTNETENMYVWICNHEYGLRFSVGDRKYGGVTGWSVLFGPLTWRHKMLVVAQEAAKSQHVAKYGMQWTSKGIHNMRYIP